MMVIEGVFLTRLSAMTKKTEAFRIFLHKITFQGDHSAQKFTLDN